MQVTPLLPHHIPTAVTHPPPASLHTSRDVTDPHWVSQTMTRTMGPAALLPRQHPSAPAFTQLPPDTYWSPNTHPKHSPLTPSVSVVPLGPARKQKPRDKAGDG